MKDAKFHLNMGQVLAHLRSQIVPRQVCQLGWTVNVESVISPEGLFTFGEDLFGHLKKGECDLRLGVMMLSNVETLGLVAVHRIIPGWGLAVEANESSSRSEDMLVDLISNFSRDAAED